MNSITKSDVFNHVSLELPQFRQPIRNITVFFHRLAGTKNNITKEGLPVSRYTIKVKQNANIDEATRTLSKLCGIRADTIIFADVIDGRLQDIYGGNKLLFEGAEEEDVVLTAYEITAATTINNSKELPSPFILAFVSQTIECNEALEPCDKRYIGFSFFVSNIDSIKLIIDLSVSFLENYSFSLIKLLCYSFSFFVRPRLMLSRHAPKCFIKFGCPYIIASDS